MKKKLGLLYGGQSAEHEVSLATAKAVTQALDYAQYEIIPLFITRKGEWIKGAELTEPAQSIEQLQLEGKDQAHDISSFLAEQQAKPFDVIFPLLHGTYGEDGTVQGLLEVLNIPYVGCGVLASSAGMDKVVMKQLFEIAGLKQVAYSYFIRKEWQKNQQALIEEMEENLTYPMFVKPANLGSSVGVSKASNQAELVEAIQIAFKYDRKVIVETGVVGREIEMAVLGNDEPKVSVAGEIKPLTDFYDYDSKYKDDNTQLLIPAPISDVVAKEMTDMAIRAFKVLDGSGLVRADFFVTADDEVLINEVNTLPGFTPVSMYPILWKNTGLPYPELIEELIQLAIERYEEKQQLHFQ
ncbi:D-alanine--D-alanine ligase [Kurthia zopfii]|uniref:D-alanine--D-alanine ligase n=1 Tax=Kurthia zopfii TaxID=1650 RepID=A0A2U3AFK8_9BACL|nr:D-alanine--D-alanine ligase [Kurthia zopfii]PWI23336.1 D-alanine--D-alanine ligase [Kurthia zopfii]TDR42208.1 D-alanine-D-alanine ligase [Kurthia zopfii]STX10873.1 D-alanine--D-alanine ligase [Kurthia zopfii]VEI05760.1 D-alanine--D-alanine ligase [Kurthia zopfii]GEK29853.1 D-alanine--D-alanine ligase [Kurthia zopfii]